MQARPITYLNVIKPNYSLYKYGIYSLNIFSVCVRAIYLEIIFFLLLLNGYFIKNGHVVHPINISFKLTPDKMRELIVHVICYNPLKNLCVLFQVKYEGFFSLYKGFLPTWARMVCFCSFLFMNPVNFINLWNFLNLLNFLFSCVQAPWSLTFWLTFEQIRRFAGSSSF